MSIRQRRNIAARHYVSPCYPMKGVAMYEIISYQHPVKFIHRQQPAHPTFWITQRIPPANMKVSAQTYMMDDFGTLAPVNLNTLIYALTP